MIKGTEEIAEIMIQEILKTITEMKKNKLPWEDVVVVEAMKLESSIKLFNKRQGKISQKWNIAVMTILGHYYSTIRLSHLYKLFT